MGRGISLVTGSAVIGAVAAVFWFNAPLVPAALGATGAAFLLYWRQRRKS